MTKLSKKVGKNKFKTLLLTIMILISSNILIAGTYYVSYNGAASWAQATNINTPCSVSTAFANARAGDTVYFRGGTYNVGQNNNGSQSSTINGRFDVAYSGTGDPENQRIIFKAYPGEVPLFNGTTGGSGDNPEYCTIFGTNGRSYITFDGFSLQANNGTGMARFFIGSGASISSYVTVKNCTLNGGNVLSSGEGNNPNGLRIQYTNNVLIQNCLIYNYRQSSESTPMNTCGIELYHLSNMIIENCTIYNCSVGIYPKSDITNLTVRYNYIYGCKADICTTPWASGYNMNNHTYHNNVFVLSRNAYMGIQVYFQGGYADNLKIYNNTFYSSTTGSTCLLSLNSSSNYITSNGVTEYNNIFYGGGTKSKFTDLMVITECDYNQYGNLGSFSIAMQYGSPSSYSSLTTWQASIKESGGNKPDTHSLSSDPKFVNLSGNYSQLTDFALRSDSPCKGTGKNGMDMGANIDLVGFNPLMLPPSTTDNAPPASPTGVSVMIIQ